MKKQATVGNLEVVYEQLGRGRPLLLLHGWGKSSQVFVPLQRLLAAGFQTVSLDLPGFGQTAAPKEAWGVEEYAGLVSDFCREIGWKRFICLGHSLGGRIALALAASQPKQIEKLILTGVPAERARIGKRWFFYFLAKIGQALFYLPPFSFFKALARRLLYRLAGERDYQGTVGLKREIFKKVIASSPLKAAAKVKTPTLIVWGEKDHFTPLLQGQVLQKAIAESRLVVVPKAGHRLPYEKVKAFAKVIKPFLETK